MSRPPRPAFDPAPPRPQNASFSTDTLIPMRAIALLLLAATPALADDAGLLKCRTLKDASARLACYDALQVPAAPPKAAAAPSAATAPSAAAPQAQPAPSTTPEQFGLERKLAFTQLEAIESTIPGRFEGWGPNENIRLANGQVWQVVDDSKGFHSIDNPKARVRRGALGAFYLEIEGTNRSPRVRRLQ